MPFCLQKSRKKGGAEDAPSELSVRFLLSATRASSVAGISFLLSTKKKRREGKSPLGLSTPRLGLNRPCLGVDRPSNLFFPRSRQRVASGVAAQNMPLCAQSATGLWGAAFLWVGFPYLMSSLSLLSTSPASSPLAMTFPSGPTRSVAGMELTPYVLAATLFQPCRSDR